MLRNALLSCCGVTPEAAMSDLCSLTRRASSESSMKRFNRSVLVIGFIPLLFLNHAQYSPAQAQPSPLIKPQYSLNKIQEEEQCTGYLRIDPIKYSKGIQGVTVFCLDGRQLRIAIRYRPEHLQYVNKKVRVSGHMTQSGDDRYVQSYGYFQVTHLDLSPDETPYANLPTEVPPPPIIRNEKELRALPEEWGVAFGVCAFTDQVDRDKSGHRIIEKVDLKLSDGFIISKHLWRMVSQSSDKYKNGAKASMLFKHQPRMDNGVNPFEFCLGENPRCGMK